MTSDELRAKLAKIERGVLVDFLVRLAEHDEAPGERVALLAQRDEPLAVAASLEQRLKRFRNGRSFISYAKSGEFARELDAWLDDVEHFLLAPAPDKAWKLIDRFIRSDAKIFERSDDSTGSIGDCFRQACGLWHRAAAALPADPAWVERVHELHAGNDYGARDAILDEAATLLPEFELRRLARIYEQEARSGPDEHERYRSIHAAAAMGQVARALGDAALYERAIRIGSPQPNHLQAADIAEQYLRFGPVERAIEWLTRPEDVEAGHERLELLARAHEQLGHREALLDVRRRQCERSLDATLFAAYAALLPAGEQETARQQALERAERSDAPVAACLFLLALGERERAAALVLRGRNRLVAASYGELLAIARRFEQNGHPLPAVACYRALTDQILAAARSKAYGHAKRYVDHLFVLDSQVGDYRDLMTHARYVAHLREHHRRKSGFWQQFERSSSSALDD